MNDKRLIFTLVLRDLTSYAFEYHIFILLFFHFQGDF